MLYYIYTYIKPVFFATYIFINGVLKTTQTWIWSYTWCWWTNRYVKG